MPSNLPDKRKQALALHGAGKLLEARAIYESLLEAAPEGPDLLGLLGVLAMQQGFTVEAGGLFGRALDAGGEPRVRLRNLNNFLVLIQREGSDEEAHGLVAAGVPDWPEGVVPDRAERAMVLSLAEALMLLGQPEQAARLLSQALPDAGDDAVALSLTGRLRLTLGDAAGAVPALEGAVALAPGDQRALIALSAALDRLGRRAEGRKAAWAYSQRFPFYSGPRRDGQTATILVLNPPPGRISKPDQTARGLHFRSNYPAQFVGLLVERYRFQSVFGNVAPEASPWQGEGADVVLNNLVNEEAVIVPGKEGRAQALVRRIGLPVINPPEQVARISRQKNAKLLAGVPGLKVPRIMRYRVADADPDTIAADIGAQFEFPVILRPPGTHMSAYSILEDGPKEIYLVHDAQELREALAEIRWTELHAIEFVDLRKPEGWYRKIRAAFIGSEIIVSSGGFFSQWMTAGWYTKKQGIEFYRANPEAVSQTRAFLTDPEGQLGAACMDALQGIRERIPLEVFGMDFDVDDAGQVVFFEATAAMVFAYAESRIPQDLLMPSEPRKRIHAAFHDLVARKIAGGAG